MAEDMCFLEANDKSLELLSINGKEENRGQIEPTIDQQNSNQDMNKDNTNNIKITEERSLIKIEPDVESMMDWVAVVSEEGEEPIEIPTENDGTILLSSLKAQFAGAIGLKFRNSSTNTLRGVRLLDNVLYAPYSGHGWGNQTYICTKSSDDTVKMKAAKKCETAVKRKFDTDPDDMLCKNQRVDATENNTAEVDSENTGICDLIILNIPFSTNEEEIRSYFEKYGDIEMIQLKRSTNGSSRGFGFVRFKSIEAQNKVTMTRHWIDQRWCVVKIPDSQEIKSAMSEVHSKIFVAGITEKITTDDLKRHFENFGTITEVFIPKPFRNYAFVTFTEQRSAKALYGREHTIRGLKVQINPAEPKGTAEKSGRGTTFRKREIMNRIKKDDERMDWRDSLAKDYRQFVELNSSRSNISQNDAHDGRTRYLSPWMNRHYDNERCFPERYQRRGYY